VTAEPSAVDAARAIVAKALSISPDRIAADTQMYDIASWDSLGQLSVILSIEEMTRVQITDDTLFEQLTSVRGIAAYMSA
jgi:acyl carrier protein